jgi:tRNA-binding protein
MNAKPQVSYAEFEKLDIRTGTVIDAQIFSKAKKPAYKLIIDFGTLGVRKSSAQIAELYSPEELVGRQVLAVVNFPPKQIADFMSECLVLGVPTPEGVVLLAPASKVGNGLSVA